jgi:leucyl/phenylalanyl-tRNA--protein transferase
MPDAFFLDPEDASAEGLVGVGGELSPARLIEAYRRGIFPWYDEQTPILWWSPDPRAILELDHLHISRRLARTLRSGRFLVTFNQAFEDVIRGCAEAHAEGTWITPEMITAYVRLHHLGHAHSVEVWTQAPSASAGTPKQQEVLAGGLYGVAVGGLFAGESMFTRIRDASKIALVHLVERLRQRGFLLFDVQFLNEHTTSLGASEIPRRTYLARLRQAVTARVTLD